MAFDITAHGCPPVVIYASHFYSKVNEVVSPLVEKKVTTIVLVHSLIK